MAKNNQTINYPIDLSTFCINVRHCNRSFASFRKRCRFG